MFFVSGIKSFAGFPNITPRTICSGNFILDVGLRRDSIEGRNFGAGNSCCRVVNGLFTTVTSCVLRTRFKGSVTLFM